VNKVKTVSELKNQRVAAAFTEWTFSRVVEEIEGIIEDKKQVKHSQIQKRIESCLDNDTIMAKFKAECDHQFLDFPLPVLIQSGGDFAVNKFQVDSNDDKLQSQAIYINVCGKYCDMSAMASRTIIVNPKDEQKAAYILAYEAEDLLIKSLKPGVKISDAYNQVKKHIAEKNPNVVLGSNFGFGIGFLFKEDALAINGTNHTIVEQGMTFHVRIAF
jgi:nucleosome binding factor SPN SPT16 subunit